MCEATACLMEIMWQIKIVHSDRILVNNLLVTVGVNRPVKKSTILINFGLIVFPGLYASLCLHMIHFMVMWSHLNSYHHSNMRTKLTNPLDVFLQNGHPEHCSSPCMRRQTPRQKSNGEEMCRR